MLCYPLSGSVLCRFDRTDTEGRCRAALSTAGRGQERERHPLPLALQRLFCSFASASVTAAPRPMRKDRDGTARRPALVSFSRGPGSPGAVAAAGTGRAGPGRAGRAVGGRAARYITAAPRHAVQPGRAAPPPAARAPAGGGGRPSPRPPRSRAAR